jgi:hypothetical protein
LYLQAGRIYYVPFIHHSNFPFGPQMWYTLMLGLGSAAAAKLCHWLCGVLLVASVYAFARRHVRAVGEDNGRTVGLVAAGIVASTPIVLWEASVAYVDLATALFTWLSLYALFNAAESARRRGDASPAAVGAAPDAAGIFLSPAVPVAGRKGGKRRAASGTARAAVPAAAGPPASTAADEGDPREATRWLLVSAALMGFALGTKLTVLGFWAILLVACCSAAGQADGRSARGCRTPCVWGRSGAGFPSPWRRRGSSSPGCTPATRSTRSSTPFSAAGTGAPRTPPGTPAIRRSSGSARRRWTCCCRRGR